MTHKNLIILTISTALSLSLLGCTKNSSTENPNSGGTTSTATNTTQSANMTAAPTTPASTDALKIEDVKVGTGTEATSGKTVTVNYTGWLTNGTKFDSSLDRNQPFKFRLGGGQVIAGWDQGVAGMKIGGKRKLTIPPNLGYGARGVGPIPPNSTLVFEVDLLGVE
jgi:FKBP-type peptidyl-prolyl cis-trans isomerase FkpA